MSNQPDAQTIRVDVAIIGAGSAGLVAYRAAKAKGATVALCDPGPLGTTCARVGCMPSKLLIAASKAARDARKASNLGVHVGEIKVDGKAVMERLRRERDRFAGFSVESAVKAPEFINAGVHFAGPNTLVSTAGHTIHAKAIIVATGSRPVIPAPLDQLRSTLVTTDSVFEIPTLPKNLAVVGTGPIGLELAQAFRGLGVEVTLFNRGTTLGGVTDPVIHATFLAILQRDLRLIERTPIIAATESRDSAKLTWSDVDGGTHSADFDMVLAATGRAPNLEFLQLANAGIQPDERGNFRFDPRNLHVPGSSVFVAGDINGFRNILHEAVDDGQIAGENAADFALNGGQAVKNFRRRTALGIVFSEPSIASGGQRFAELEPGSFEVGEISFANQGRSRIDQEDEGALRIYADKQSGRLLGFEMTSYRAEHHAHQLAWAIQQGLNVRDMLDLPYYHPVAEEGLRTALQALAKKIPLEPRTRIPLDDVE